MRKTAILFTCMTLLIIACNKQEVITPDDPTYEEATLLKRGENEHEPSTIDPEILVDNPNEPITTGVSVDEGVLKFENMDTFEIIMGSLVNQPFVKLDNWESALGFTSIRSVNEALLEDETDTNIMDEDVFDDGRVQDAAFESVLNADNKVIIGAFGYTFDYSNMEDRILTIWDASDPNIVVNTVNLSNKTTISTNRCGPYLGEGRRISVATQYLDSKKKKRVVGRKGCENWQIYSSVFMSTKYSEKNWLGIWRGKKKDVAIQLDQWHFLEYELANPMSYDGTYTETNKEKIGNDKKLSHVFKSSTKGHFGVCQYGRVHHWKVSEGYNNDVHTESW